jgi:hypothetical protein
MKKLFLAASGLFAAIPGLVILQTGLGTPPGDNYKMLFGGTVEAFGTLILIILWVNRTSIRRMRPRRATKWSIILIVVCFISIASYITLYNQCVIKNKKWHATVYFPLWLSGEIANDVADKGGRNALVNEYSAVEVMEIIDKMPNIGLALAITTVLHLLLYQAIFTSLAAAFGILGIHQGQSLVSQERPAPAPPPEREHGSEP